jgi:hypothetical protein
MRVTMQAWQGNGKTHPPLWDVLVGGHPIGVPVGDRRYSMGRVLKMGRRYLPVLDGYDIFPFSFESRKECAEYVAEQAIEQGVLNGNG